MAVRSIELSDEKNSKLIALDLEKSEYLHDVAALTFLGSLEPTNCRSIEGGQSQLSPYCLFRDIACAA